MNLKTAGCADTRTGASAASGECRWTPEQAATFQELVGSRVVERNDTFWVSWARGFWRPVDFLETRPRQVPPSVFASGYQQAVAPDEATGYLPKLLIPDVANFDPTRWSRKTRRDLRKCQQAAQVGQAADPELLLAQGYDVWQDASRRNGQAIPPSRREFERLIRARWQVGPQIAIIGVQDNKLGGFLLAHVIGVHCYLEQVVVATAARSWPLGVGLYALALQEARRRGAHVVDTGLMNPAVPPLDWFKTRVGATLVPTPIYANLFPGLGPWLKRRQPATYERLVGAPTPLEWHVAALA